LLAAYRERHPKGDSSLIAKAYETAEKAHDGQFDAPVRLLSPTGGVATVLAGLGMDDVTLAAALLHDSVEDTAVSLEEIEAGFGPIVARSWTGSPSSNGSRSTRGPRHKRRRCARCSWPWRRTEGLAHKAR